MTRVPPTEITGLYGAMMKRFAKKMFGEVPDVARGYCGTTSRC